MEVASAALYRLENTRFAHDLLQSKTGCVICTI
jgi:hypothetical protein